MQYASGGNLEQVIEQRDHDLPWSVRMSLALDIAKGLSYLHAMGWFHRDLTSKVSEKFFTENLMIHLINQRIILSIITNKYATLKL